MYPEVETQGMSTKIKQCKLQPPNEHIIFIFGVRTKCKHKQNKHTERNVTYPELEPQGLQKLFDSSPRAKLQGRGQEGDCNMTKKHD